MASQVPHTYTGYGPKYDTDGKTVIGEQVITSKTAQDANTYVNPAEVKAAVDKLRTTVKTNVDNIKSKLQNVAVSANGEMLQVEDHTMEPIINEAANSLGQIGPGLESTFNDIVTFAETEHDKKQIEYNQAAEAEVRGTAGVTRVEQS
jgi:predicted lipoprotein